MTLGRLGKGGRWKWYQEPGDGGLPLDLLGEHAGVDRHAELLDVPHQGAAGGTVELDGHEAGCGRRS